MRKIINFENSGDRIDAHIIAIAIAEYGAMGQPGDVIFITDRNETYKQKMSDVAILERKLKDSDIWFKCIEYLNNAVNEVPTGWSYTYMGEGNHLFMISWLTELFQSVIGEDVSESEINARWIEVIDGIMRERLYQQLVNDIRNDYKQRSSNGITDKSLVWCELCQEVNLWTYWQGRGNLYAKIILVGQDWGCVFDEKFEKFKGQIEMMNANIPSVDYAGTTSFNTDVNLKKLFSELGYDLDQNEKDLFFTNLALGYRQKGSTGDLQRNWLTSDVVYLERLVNILKPEVIICLGKETYEVAASTLGKEKVRIDNFYESLECGNNYTVCKLDCDKLIRVYGVAHCGNYGVMNRKKNAVGENREKDGLALQKEDWKQIKKYLDMTT